MSQIILIVLVLMSGFLSITSLINFDTFSQSFFKIINGQVPSNNYVIVGVDDSSIAQEVGLQIGDIIQAVNGEEPYTLFEDRKNDGETLELTILRETEELTFSLNTVEGQQIGIEAERAREGFNLLNNTISYVLFSTVKYLLLSIVFSLIPLYILKKYRLQEQNNTPK